MNPALRAHLDLVAPREKASRNLPQWSTSVPRCEHGVSLLDDCAPCDERYSREIAAKGKAKLSPWNAAAKALKDAAARIAALPGDTSIVLMHMQEAQEALDDWYAPGELSEADVREREQDDIEGLRAGPVADGSQTPNDATVTSSRQSWPPEDVREWERDDMLARHFPLVAALEAAVRGTR